MADPQIAKEYFEHALAFVDEVVRGYPGRSLGERSCLEAAQRIAAELERHCDPGSVRREGFSCHPRAFLKVLRVAVILYVVATLAVVWGKPLVALGALLLSLSLWLCQVVLYLRVFDVFYPRRKGINVWGRVEPAGEVLQQVILSGHHDAPWVFHYIDWSPRRGPLVAALGVVSFFVALLIAGYQLGSGGCPWWMQAIVGGGLVLVVPLWWFTTNAVSPGAGDNMIGSALAVEATRIFADAKRAGNPLLAHTRILCLSLDGEECGLRGSMDFVKRYRDELSAIKTYVFNIDTVYQADRLHFIDRDLNLTVPCSRAMAEELTGIARGLGYGAQVSQLPFGAGSTDAASFARAGIEATTLIAVNLDLGKLDRDLVYHTPRDLPESIQPEVVSQCLHVVRDYLLARDRACL